MRKRVRSSSRAPVHAPAKGPILVVEGAEMCARSGRSSHESAIYAGYLCGVAVMLTEIAAALTAELDEKIDGLLARGTLPGPPVLPTCCRRHRAIGRADGNCGEVTADDLRALYYVAAEGLASAHPEDYAEGALRAVRVLCESLTELRRAVEKMDSAFVDADHYPAAVRLVVDAARGR